MATGWPMKTTYVDGDVYAASDVNDTNGTINLLGQSVSVTAGKNKVINAAAQIWQRGTSFTTSGAYTADRFAEVNGVNSITYTRSTDVPSSLGFQYSISRAGTGSNMAHRIESANATQLAGQTVTLSFYYKSTAGTDNFNTLLFYANSVDNFSANTQIGSTQTIATPATSWTRVSYTYTNISANAANGLSINFTRGLTATSTTLITGIQLELGPTATAFQTASANIGGELALCQRYYYLHASANGDQIGPAWYNQSTEGLSQVKFPVTMRTAPTLSATTGTGIYSFFVSNVNDGINSLTIFGSSVNATGLFNASEASGTIGTAGRLQNTSGFVAFVAEL